MWIFRTSFWNLWIKKVGFRFLCITIFAFALWNPWHVDFFRWAKARGIGSACFTQDELLRLLPIAIVGMMFIGISAYIIHSGWQGAGSRVWKIMILPLIAGGIFMYLVLAGWIPQDQFWIRLIGQLFACFVFAVWYSSIIIDQKFRGVATAATTIVDVEEGAHTPADHHTQN